MHCTHCTHCKHSADVNRRLARISGQLNGIREMVNEGRPCGDLLTPRSSANSASPQGATLILTEHLEHCERSGEDTDQVIAQLQTAIDQFAKLK